MRTQTPARTATDGTTPPQWIKINEAVRLFGLSRSTLYLLMRESHIQSRQVCPAGGKRGTRLIKFTSLKTYIEADEKSVKKAA